MHKIYREISKLGKLYGASKIVLFGSRARKDNRERSDIDLAIYNMPCANQEKFTEAIYQLPTLLEFDLIFISKNTNKELLNNIEKDGILLMSKYEEKKAKLTDAVNRLEEAINDYNTHGYSSIRDGVIQRFEFCAELSWKVCREYLLEEGYEDINSPKSVMKVAYSDKLISDEETWIEILNSRNKTSHIYDEDTAIDIFNSISNKYFIAMKNLLEKFNS